MDVLSAGLQASPGLKLAICVPRLPDFVVARANRVRAALAQRKQAIGTLALPYRQRVAAFAR
ncbi:hypothetical protein [Azohydromonas caseinilytica]|uniref:Uncharacterized protein n=1 Tax=Azohydromonas caseinilytica TaxID=2728836 RepID=A0A848FEA5_9BURK|nr:hypothetical protein [Azohydromonas caseinilytica]NML17145.1 hypothetical protein [Azohydromonas caseinilytica]